MLRSGSIAFLFLATVALAGVRPVWSEANVHTTRGASVQAIVAGAHHDLVVVDGGLEAGLRRGVVAEVRQGSTPKGRLLIAEATAQRAVALIIDLQPEQTLMTGDRVARALVRL